MREVCEWPQWFWGLGSHPLDGPVDRGSSYAEEFGELNLGGATGVVQLQQLRGLVRLQLWLLAAQPTLGFGYLHSFLGAQSDQVASNSATIANTLNSDRTGGCRRLNHDRRGCDRHRRRARLESVAPEREILLLR
jgi:hypothetical protein